MAKNNDIECFMYYMYNRWSLSESKHVFGDDLGTHIYGKWVKLTSHHDTLYWYGELDKDCRNKLANRAKELYSNNN